MLWAMSFPEWFCSAHCGRKVRWNDAALDVESGRLYGVRHLECSE
jgi:hypothetical protein